MKKFVLMFAVLLVSLAAAEQAFTAAYYFTCSVSSVSAASPGYECVENSAIPAEMGTKFLATLVCESPGNPEHVKKVLGRQSAKPVFSLLQSALVLEKSVYVNIGSEEGCYVLNDVRLGSLPE